MVIAVSQSKRSAFIQSRITTGPQSVCLHAANRVRYQPKHSDKTARGPPNRTVITLRHSTPSLSSPRGGVTKSPTHSKQSPIASEPMAPFQP